MPQWAGILWMAGRAQLLTCRHDHAWLWGCSTCLGWKTGQQDRCAHSHLSIYYTSTRSPGPGGVKGRSDGGRSYGHTQEEPRALKELGAGSQKVTGKKERRKRETVGGYLPVRMASPLYHSFAKTSMVPPHHGQAAGQDSACPTLNTLLRRQQQQLPIWLCPQPLAWGHPLPCQSEQGRTGEAHGRVTSPACKPLPKSAWR